MDPKTTAKSKRSHSLQGKRNSPHSSSSAPNKDKKKQPQQPQKQQQQQQQKPPQQGGDHPPRPARPSLPSNWDRYEEGAEGHAEGEDGEELVAAGLAEGGDCVVVKSKGADFGEVIEQARSQQRDGDGGFQSLLDDSIPEYIQGLSPMLSARGNSLLLQCRNDNFIVDDDATSSFEVPFLSLDLHALAVQLAKLKLSKRLFIDAKYIPEEMEIDLSNEISMQEFDLEESSRENEKVLDSLPSRLHVCNDDERKILPKEDILRSIEGQDIIPKEIGKKILFPLSSLEGTKTNQYTSSVFLDDDSAKEARRCILSLNQQNAPYTKPDLPSKFGAAVAEAELDMLLDSFAEAKPFDSSGGSPSSSNDSTPQLVARDLSGHKSDLPSRNDFYNSSYTVKNDSLDSTINDLIGAKPACSSRTDAGPSDTVFLGAPPQSHSSSTLSLDDVLAETSANLKDQKHMKCPQSEREFNNTDISSVRSHSVSKALDDFDSWLDTL